MRIHAHCARLLQTALLLIGWLLSSASQANDFMAQPALACDWFAQQGLRASLAWSKPKADQPYWWCQYATQFGGATPFYVRSGRAVLDEKDKKVSVALSVQAMGSDGTRADAQKALTEFTQAFLRAQGKTYSAEIQAAVEGKAQAVKTVSGVEITPGDESIWEKHKVLGFSLSSAATPQVLAAAALGPSAASKANEAQLEKTLGDRCDAAIRSASFEGKPSVDFSAYKRSGKKASESQYVFDYSEAGGSAYNCRVCDDLNPNVNCGFTMGALIAFEAKDGSNSRVPAELDRKCVGALQKQLKDPSDPRFVDIELVNNIKVDAAHTEKSYVFNLRIKDDADRYRCVIRKNDMNYSVESSADGRDWRGLVGGRMM
jgi:hypothetical protein